MPASSNTTSADVTRLLREWRLGDSSAAEKLMPLVYDELHRAAARAMRSESDGHTLQPTALVNEVYLRLVDQTDAEWKNRSQFYGVAAQVMRRVLVDYARTRMAEKRGGGLRAVTLDEINDGGSASSTINFLALHDALDKLATLDPDQVRIVELRYFTGLTIEETAEALDISAATVKREWAVARAWLRRELDAA
ncbi:MAG TPA: sigma-70 family RNA polymerase sigma factor [Gemmatimonadaceae bacterium]|nr:sigma-70 family RNA polymerase sigma factor [Gemmatimonadaceae bacterium]